MSAADRNRNRRSVRASATQRTRLPAMQPVDTGNPALNQLLDAFRERHEVREGARGNPFEQVVTRRDLVELGLLRSADGTPAMSPGSGVVVAPGPNGTLIPKSADQFAADILNSALFQALQRRIDDPARFASLPARVQELLLAPLAQIQGRMSAEVRRLDETIATANESMALTMTEVAAAVVNAAAGVRQLSFANANRNRAVAGQVTTITSRLDDVGGATFEEAITTVADRATGLEAQWTLKVSAGKAIAGIGAAATENTDGNVTSQVIIMADQFAVVGPGDTISGSGTTVDPYTADASRVPFGVDTGNNTIYLNGNVRISSGTGTKLSAIGKRITLTAPTDSFILDGRGGSSPSSILLTATKLNGLTGTSNWSVIDGTASLTGSGDTRTLTFANLTTDTATIEVSVTDDSVTYTAQYTIKKSLNGVRGSVAGTGLFYGISSSSWNSSKANRVISNIINGEALTTDLASTSLNSIGDSVTLSNGTNFAQTRYWNGAAWTTPGTIIDGDLLVDGTVSADALNVTTLSAITANLGTVTAGSITGTADIEIAGNAIFDGAAVYDGVSWAVTANTSLSANGGVVGRATSGIGVRGEATTGEGVMGVASASGGQAVYGLATHASAVGVFAFNNTSNVALEINGTGKLKWNGYTWDWPTGDAEKVLGANGNWLDLNKALKYISATSTATTGSITLGQAVGFLTLETLDGILGTVKIPYYLA